MRILLAAIFVSAGCSLAAAQSSTATSGTVTPMTTAPSPNTLPNGRLRSTKIPPAARSGEEGLRVGNVPPDTPPVEIRRVK